MNYKEETLMALLNNIERAVESFKETLEDGDNIDYTIDAMWNYILKGEQK